jgi:glutamate-1-semialdehyde aminotransferase
LRIARTVTGRDKVVVFEGGYHGIFDEVIVRGGKQGAGLPAAPGIPRSHVSNMIVLPYGSAESLEFVKANASELAAVMVETVQSRNPGLQPFDFLRELRSITEDSGSALIFDEVVTGFRVHPGGMQAFLDIRADLAVYGKVVAGGYPIGLIGGKARFMDALDGGHWTFGDESIPEVGVTFFAGTFVRHPAALAATKAVLQRMKTDGPQLQLGLAERAAQLANDLNRFLEQVGANVSLEQFSSFFYVSVGSDEEYGGLLFYLLRLYGIHVWEYRPCFLTTSHSDDDIAAFSKAFKRAVSELVRNGLIRGDAVAVERINKATLNEPPVDGARLGKDASGAPAWFVPDPDRPGKYLQVIN